MRDRVQQHGEQRSSTIERSRRTVEPAARKDHGDGGAPPSPLLAPTLPRYDFASLPPGPEHSRTDARPRDAESDTDEAPVPDDERRLAQVPPSDAGVVPTDGGTPADAGAPAPAAPALSASFSISGNGSYSDNATESRKKVTFNATWKGGAKTDYIIVNWIKGHMKDAKGKPYKVKMFDADVDYDFADWRVDSLDKDPAYWSSGGTRWRYTVDAADKFSATDNPGPMLDTDGKGAVAKVDFKTAVYKAADVGTNESGPSISATPLSSFDTWEYHVEVLGGGKFNHPA